jgi:predicted DNA-binding protein
MTRHLQHDHCTSIRMPSTWHTRMHAIARQFGLSDSEIYRQAVQHYLRVHLPHA